MKALQHVHLNGLRAAEAVGRLGSLQAAAVEIGVTIGAVSQHVIKLERQLGRRLFDRTGRGMTPAVGAVDFLAQLTGAMTALDSAVARSVRRDANVLTLSVAPVFAAKWLVPRLASFARLNPGIRVQLEATTDFADLDHGDIDLAIRVGAGNWAGVSARFLLPQEVFPVAAPVLAEMLREPGDLCRVPIVRDAHSTLSWSIWLEHFGIDEVSLQDGSSFTDASLCLDAAITGQGAMLAWDTLAADALADGRLIAPFRYRAVTGLGYWLLRAEGRRPTAAMDAFSNWLSVEAQKIAAATADTTGPITVRGFQADRQIETERATFVRPKGRTAL